LVAQLVVGLHWYGPVGVLDVTWQLLGFFTILPHIGVVLLLSAVGLGISVPVRLRGTFTLAASGAGLIFHLLLAHLYDFKGLAWWSDLALHTLTPLAMLYWWAAYTPKHQVQWNDPFWWVTFPIGYGIYALIRGPLNLDNQDPYPFLDPDKIGYEGVAKVFVAMTVGFLLFGMIMVALSKVTHSPRRKLCSNSR
jgi:uncharacterized membrane protein